VVRALLVISLDSRGGDADRIRVLKRDASARTFEERPRIDEIVLAVAR
jgi:hypothetical protein